jgi:phenylpropionate dioxygenase-like ring-hydroxylating dioxygenase large terminal subunit
MKARKNHDYAALIKSDRVHSRLYVDPQIFVDEIQTIFGRGWVYVGHEGEVPKAGDFALKRIGQQPVIMVRDHDGRVRLLLNRCRHRAATVCAEERGNTRAFRCAYHGWTFRLNGELSGIPFPEAYGRNFHKRDFGLTSVPRVAGYRGFFFGSLSSAGVTLEEHLGRAAQELDLFVGLSQPEDVEVRAGINKYDYRGNWKLAVENSMDGYHPNFTHQSFVAELLNKIRSNPSPEHQSAFNPKSFNPGGGVSRDLGNGHVMLDYGFRMYDPLNRDALPAVRATTPSGAHNLAELARRFGSERAADMLREGCTHTLIFPNLILIGVQIRVVQPISINQTQVCLYPTTLKWLPEEVNAIRLRCHEAFFGSASFGGTDDVEIFERVQAGLMADVDPWLLLSRGLHRERRDEEGLTVGDISDELTQRAIWRQWKRVMMQEHRQAGSRRARSARSRLDRGEVEHERAAAE